MTVKKILKRISCLLLATVFMSVGLNASAAVLTFETQYEYDSANPAWLTDFVIKESMQTVEGMAQRVELVPVPDYPYTETPESFATDVNYFTSLYNLKEGSQRAGYIYFFEILNSKSEFIAGDVSDADIKDYLESIGIVYPSEVGDDELVMARALFTAFAAGNVNGSLFVSGAQLEEVLIAYLSELTGMNVDSLRSWMPDGSLLSLDEYILAASKLTLWSNGYDVSVDTPEDEVFRLVALMTVKAQGISVDTNLSFDELNLKYIAALLSEKYSVSVDSEKLGKAIDSGGVPFYILQLMGKDNGISIREDNVTFEEAFNVVAENTDYFDVESGEFYADISLYDVSLQRRCSSIWIYPTAYSASRDGSSTVITVNDTVVRNNYYNEIQLDPELDTQSLEICVVTVINGVTHKCEYTVRLKQGSYSAVEGDTPVTEIGGESFGSSDSIVLGVLSSLGLNIDVSEILDGIFLAVPDEITDVVSYIAPTFSQTGLSQSSNVGEDASAEVYLDLLDEIGMNEDYEISGIPGLDSVNGLSENELILVFFGE